MSYAETLKSRIEENLANQSSVKTFDLSLVTLIFDVVLNVIEACRSQNDDTTVSTSISQPGLLQRWVVRRAVRKSDIATADRTLATAVIEETLSQSNDISEIKGLFAEMDGATPDWSLF